MIVGINKPVGPTSHDIIYQVRRITHVKRVGHAGTLDPAAAGVLVVAIGREFTKQLSTITDHDKEYVATVTLGATSNTDDREGEITVNRVQGIGVSRIEVDNSIGKFIGTIMQVPPAYSAIKKDGRKAYDLARKGIDVKMEPREVTIHSIEVMSFTYPELVIKVHCGKGVYIRSLARDIGTALGMGGYMSALTRTRVGDFRIENALSIPEFETFWSTHNDTLTTANPGI
jgi:tRNA pseudouridine55 synthase